MRLLRRKYLLRADVEHVVHCFTDLGYIRGVITSLCEEEGEELGIEKRGDTLYFIGKEPLLKMTKFSAQGARRFTSELAPIPERLKRFGNVTISCEFRAHRGATLAVTELESEQTPGLLWRGFIRLAVFVLVFQSRKHEKAYIRAIEQSA